MDKKYLDNLIAHRKKLRKFIQFPWLYEELSEKLEDKVSAAKKELQTINAIIDKHFKNIKKKKWQQ